MRVFFVYPVCPGPVGGLKQTRLTIELLCELGYPAQLIVDYRDLPRETDDTHYYGLQTPLASFDFASCSNELRPDDVLIFPEHHLDRYLAATADVTVRKGVYNRNGFGALASRPNRKSMRQLEFAFANSPYTASISRFLYRLPRDRVFQIHNWIVRPPFGRDPDTTRELAIAYMPRKIPETVRKVREEVQRREPDVKWVEISEMGERDVAESFRRCAIFFSSQNREGFGNPALEAMACGCLVAGYAGTFPFPSPYASSANGCWAQERSEAAAVRTVLKAIRTVRENADAYSQYLSAAEKTAEPYSKATALVQMREAMSSIMVTAGSVGDAVTRGHYLKSVPQARLGLQAYLASLYILARKQRLQLGDLVRSPF